MDRVKVLSREESLITDSQQELIFTHLLHSYLSRTDTAGNTVTHTNTCWRGLWRIACHCAKCSISDPGCFSKITRINEWLQRNLGIFSKYATASQLKMLYSHFTVSEPSSAMKNIRCDARGLRLTPLVLCSWIC